MSETVKYNNPAGLPQPWGTYSHVSRAKASELVFIAGQLAVNEAGELVGKGDFGAQMRQVFDNLGRALRSEGLSFANVTKFTTFLVHSQDIEGFMTVRKELLSKLYPSGQYQT